MYDLVLSEYNDLVIGGNRDLAGVSGTELIEQRIRLRLKLRRGSWLYDETKTLGSQLFQLAGKTREVIETTIPSLVREALRPMQNEIEVNDVVVPQFANDPIEGEQFREIEILVLYSLLGESGSSTEEISEQRSISVNIPLGGGGV